MNKMVKINDKEVRIICENNEEIKGIFQFEKKSGITWVKLPDDNITGHIFINSNKFDENGEYEFPSKNRVSSGWKSKLTEEEKSELESLESRIKELKSIGMSRKSTKIGKDIDNLSEEELRSIWIKINERLNK